MENNSSRKQEIRRLLSMSPEAVMRQAGERLVVCRDVEALYARMADDILHEIQQTAARKQPLRLILPVGPTGQYPLLADRINSEGLSLAHCWFYFMDEYCDENGAALDAEHPLSFKGAAQRLFLNRLHPHAKLDSARVIFPDENNIHSLRAQIEAADGIDTCYGGIGIHGHVAFNEPEPGVRSMGCRQVKLNDFTVTINAIRSQVGGNLEGFPHRAYTLGMEEILAAKQIRLYCRNGSEYDWANTVLRLALFGEPGDDYPVTHIRDRNYVIITDEVTLQSPRVIV